MKDETYSFISDVKEKGTVARSSHNRRSHTGRGGKVRFPSDNLSKKELQKMSGECVSYRLNEPLTWAEFKKMPDDIKVTYIKLLQGKWKVPDIHIGRMMGVGYDAIRNEVRRLGFPKGHAGRVYWDKEGFYAWANGVDSLPTPVPEEDDVRQEEEPEDFMENDLPFDIVPLDVPEAAPEVKFVMPIPQTACPNTGSLSFKCPANIALNTMKDLLQNEMVAISITWRAVEEGGDDDD